MIRMFWAENFMSIRDRQEISFEATKDDTARELLTQEVKPNLRLNKLVILYGANASGKTNLLYAMNQAFFRLFQPKHDRSETIPFHPFALNENNPTKLYVSFYINSVRYDYLIEYDQTKIISEKLEYAPNGVLSLFYTRKFIGKDMPPVIEFGKTLGLLAKTKDAFFSNTLNNHSVLSTYAKVSVGEDAEQIKFLFNWIKESVHEIDGDESDFLVMAKEALGDKLKHKFILESLKKADFNISEVVVDEVANDIPDNIRKQITDNDELPEFIKQKILVEKKEDLIFTHKSSSGEFSLNRKAQSSGTLNFFRLLDCLYDMICGNHIYMFDEIEFGLHYDLLIHFLTIFMMNTDRSQMIITTQDQLLLGENFIRRDMVWFAEKSKDDSVTRLNRASDYGIHKNASLYNTYRTGKIGAKPELGSVFVDDNCCG